MTMRLNLVFHDIVINGKYIHNPFSITEKYYIQLTSNLIDLTKQNKIKFQQVCFYFDDGYQSFKDIVFLKIKNNYENYALSVVADWIGKRGFLNQEDIIKRF